VALSIQPIPDNKLLSEIPSDMVSRHTVVVDQGAENEVSGSVACVFENSFQLIMQVALKRGASLQAAVPQRGERRWANFKVDRGFVAARELRIAVV
jgi:hypothetical protein